MFRNVLTGIVALFTGDIDGALKAFQTAGETAANLVFDAFQALLGLFKEIYDWIANKISGALDTVKEKAKGAIEIISTPSNKAFDFFFGSDEENLTKGNAKHLADLAQRGAAGGGGPATVDSSSTTTITGTTIQVDARGQTNAQVGEAVANALNRKLVSSNNRGTVNP